MPIQSKQSQNKEKLIFSALKAYIPRNPVDDREKNECYFQLHQRALRVAYLGTK
jgi:hypothetical protein